MDRLLDEIESYWSTRTEGYSEVNEKELKGMQKKAWLKTLESEFTNLPLNSTDISCAADTGKANIEAVRTTPANKAIIFFIIVIPPFKTEA